MFEKAKGKKLFLAIKKYSYFSLISESSNDCPQIRERKRRFYDSKKLILLRKKVSVTTITFFCNYANFFS